MMCTAQSAVKRIYNVNSDDTDSYDDDEVVIINAKNLKQKRINYMSGRFDKFLIMPMKRAEI